MNLIEKAEAIARKAHDGQFRRDGVTPYIVHPERVVARLRPEDRDSDFTVAVAWLHDVVEDNGGDWSVLEGLPSAVICAVGDLTKRSHDTYEQYLRRINGNYRARTVKIADILDNLSDAPTDKQIVKYSKALLYLHDHA